MNFSYGIIAIVGVLAAISIGFIAMDPDDIIEPRSVGQENTTVCTMQWDPMCGVDGETYGNMCMLNAAGVELSHRFECGIDDPKVLPRVEPTPEPELVACTMEWNPMCGVDGMTYGNPCGLDAAGVELDYEGECIISESPEVEPTETAQLPIASGIHQVNIAEGSGAPGCEETDECFLPYSITIPTGETVVWNNIDSAAHTVTSGNVADGHDGMFDSSLFMSGLTFEFTFNEAGSFDYFCMVHPWMTGKVIVNDVEDMVVIEEPEPEPTSESLPMTAIVSIPVGVAVPGCEGTNECYLPFEITVAKGATVSWMNADSAAHTVSSGTVEEGLSGIFDSSLFMPGSVYEFTFNEAGSFDYFCMVHPWMTGIVNVN